MLTTLAWTALGFLSGALPFSVWIGRVALRTDIRAHGDGNPGATNVFRAGGKAWGVLAVVLDYLKAAVPVGAANLMAGIEGPALVAVALAPILGHAFSPFLGFRGGKALAATFGTWTGLTLWVVPVPLGALFALWRAVLSVDGWAVLAAMLCLLPLLFILGDSVLPAVWTGNTALLVWRHRTDLAHPPRLRRSRPLA